MSLENLKTAACATRLAQSTHKKDKKSSCVCHLNISCLTFGRIRDAYSLQLCQSLLHASNLSDAQHWVLFHFTERCKLSLVFLSLNVLSQSVIHCILSHFRVPLWLMRIKKQILLKSKLKSHLIQTGKKPLFLSEQFSIRFLNDTDTHHCGFKSNIKSPVLPIIVLAAFYLEKTATLFNILAIGPAAFSIMYWTTNTADGPDLIVINGWPPMFSANAYCLFTWLFSWL